MKYPKMWDDNTVLLYKMAKDEKTSVASRFRRKLNKTVEEVDAEETRIVEQKEKILKNIEKLKKDLFKKCPIGTYISFEDNQYTRWTGVVIGQKEICNQGFLLVERDRNVMIKGKCRKKRGKGKKLVSMFRNIRKVKNQTYKED